MTDKILMPSLDKDNFILMLGIFLVVLTWIQLPSTLGYQKEYQATCNQGWTTPNIPYITPSDESNYFKDNPKMTCWHLTGLVGMTTGIAIFAGGSGMFYIIRFFTTHEIIIRRRDYFD